MSAKNIDNAKRALDAGHAQEAAYQHLAATRDVEARLSALEAKVKPWDDLLENGPQPVEGPRPAVVDAPAEAGGGGLPTVEWRADEKTLREALHRIHDKAMGKTKEPYMRIPADPKRDADLLIDGAIDELVSLRDERDALRAEVENERLARKKAEALLVVERKAGEKLHAELAAVRAATREECAKVADRYAAMALDASNGPSAAHKAHEERFIAATHVAADIRVGAPATAPEAAPASTPLIIDYVNHRAVRGRRRITPHSIFFGVTEWHPEPQWFLRATDLDKKATRDFALKDLAAPPSAQPGTPTGEERAAQALDEVKFPGRSESPIQIVARHLDAHATAAVQAERERLLGSEAVERGRMALGRCGLLGINNDARACIDAAIGAKP